MNFKMIIRRGIAFVIDWNIMFGGCMVLMAYGPGANPDYFIHPTIRMLLTAGFWLGLAWIVFYGLFKDCLFGRRSLGKLITGLKIVRADTQEKVSFGRLLLRNIPYFIVQVELVMVLANKGRRLGDLLAGTKVTTNKS